MNCFYAFFDLINIHWAKQLKWLLLILIVVISVKNWYSSESRRLINYNYINLVLEI
jgi:hypothetical protein